MSASYSTTLFVQSNYRQHANIVLFMGELMMTNPTPTPSLFLEPSKYRVQIMGSVNSTQKLIELLATTVQSLESTFVQILESTIVQFYSTI